MPRHKTDRERDIEFAVGIAVHVFAVVIVVAVWALGRRVKGSANVH